MLLIEVPADLLSGEPTSWLTDVLPHRCLLTVFPQGREGGKVLWGLFTRTPSPHPRLHPCDLVTSHPPHPNVITVGMKFSSVQSLIHV